MDWPKRSTLFDSSSEKEQDIDRDAEKMARNVMNMSKIGLESQLEQESPPKNTHTREGLEQSAREAWARAEGKLGLEVPEGFRTAAQWGKLVGIPRTTAQGRLEAMVDKKIAEKWKFGRHFHYKLKNL